ncbi:hypothetical protein [Flindersiella endophytica]
MSKSVTEYARRVRLAQVLVAVLQLVPAAMLLTVGGIGAVRYSPIALVVPLAVLGLCLWQLRSAWWRPHRWAVAGSYAGIPAGLATGAAAGLSASAAGGRPPGTAVLPAFACAAGVPLLILLAAYGLRAYALRAEPSQLAASRLELPFRLAGTSAVALVGKHDLTLYRTSQNNYRASLVNRTQRTSVSLEQMHVHQVRTLDAPAEIELPGMHYPARVRAGTRVVFLQAGRDRWMLPVVDAESFVDVIRLRKQPTEHR